MTPVLIQRAEYGLTRVCSTAAQKCILSSGFACMCHCTFSLSKSNPSLGNIFHWAKLDACWPVTLHQGGTDTQHARTAEALGVLQPPPMVDPITLIVVAVKWAPLMQIN